MKVKNSWDLTREEKQADFVIGLRKLADFIEAHSAEFELDPVQSVNISRWIYTKDELKTASRILRKAGKLVKNFQNDYIEVKHNFSATVSMGISIAREHVCEKIVTGTKTIEAEFYPARTEEIVEWVCNDKSLLK